MDKQPVEGMKRCRECGYETEDTPLNAAETWHYVRTGESRHGGCPAHPWGWHYWNTDKKPPPRITAASFHRCEPRV